MDEEIIVDNIDGGSDSTERDAIISSLDEINEKLDSLTTEETEEETEDVTEEITEIPVEDLPVQKKDMESVEEGFQRLGSKLDTLNRNVEGLQATEEEPVEQETTEEASLAMIEETSEDENGDLVLVDHGVDGHLYMSTTVENADLNDIYSMLLSTRNVLLLGVMLGLVICCFLLFRMAIERLLYR